MRRLFLIALSLSALSVLPARAALDTTAEHALLMDAANGQVLWEKDGLTAMPPASMSKLMTLELLFQRLKDGRLKLTDTLPVSQRAWSTQGSKMFVELNSRIPIESLIRGIIIDSGNDACVVVAEGLGGTVEGFADMMNKRAKQIGLAQSHFVNPDGLPDPPGQLMSAMDLAKLARHLIRDYPDYYHYFSEKEFTWHNITQPNRDLVLGALPGADGLKTGHIDASGYGITISAKRGDTRFVLVLNGLRYPQYNNDYFPNIKRAEEAGRLMDLAFREFRPVTIAAAGKVVGQAALKEGKASSVAVTPKNLISATMQMEAQSNFKIAVKTDPNLTAPVAQGQRVGTMTVTAPDFPAMTVPVYATEAVERANIFSRLWNRYFGKH
ncbi:MAG TPA: D-alanyl-D-alanine carboxypeptidase family protein [Rhizomicrobium sp.]